MDTKDKKKIHDGHRERLRGLAVNAGLENISEIQAVELLLTFLIPRKDVNPISHELLEKFGSFSGILEADEKNLQAVKGIGPIVADKITLFHDFFFLFQRSKLREKKKLVTRQDLKDYCSLLLSQKPLEEFFIVGLNANNEVVKSEKLSKGLTNQVNIEFRDVSEFVLKFLPTSVLICHCHPDGAATPSLHDIESTKAVSSFLNLLKVKLIDHIIVGKDSIFSFFEAGLKF